MASSPQKEPESTEMQEVTTNENSKKSKTDKDRNKSVPFLALFRFASTTDKILMLIGTLCAIACGNWNLQFFFSFFF